MKVGLLLAAFSLFFQVGRSLAQTNNPIQPAAINYNAIEWSQISSNELTAIVKNANPSKIPANAWGIILKKVDWFQLPTNIQYYVSDNVDWSLVPTNIIEYYNQPVAWPNSGQALKHSAELMRASVDTNWLAMIADKLTNQPAVLQFTNTLTNGTQTVVLVTNADMIFNFEAFSMQLTSILDEYAGYLTNPKLNAYLGQSGYGAEIPDSLKNKEVIYFDFLSKNGPASEFRKIVSGVSRARVKAAFYDNGKLASFAIYTSENKENAHFGNNGQLQHFSWIMNEKFSIHIDVDASGSPHVKGYFLRKPYHSRPLPNR